MAESNMKMKDIRAKHAKYQDISLRLRSFKSGKIKKFKKFALSGFFWEKDKIKCFQCGRISKNFCYINHSDTCRFIKKNKKTFNYTKNCIVNSSADEAIFEKNICAVNLKIFLTKMYHILKIEHAEYFIVIDFKLFLVILEKAINEAKSFTHQNLRIVYDKELICIKKKNLLIISLTISQCSDLIEDIKK